MSRPALPRFQSRIRDTTMLPLTWMAVAGDAIADGSRVRGVAMV